jgi:hypothetical protein
MAGFPMALALQSRHRQNHRRLGEMVELADAVILTSF